MSLLAACSAGESPPPPAQTYADPGYVDAGDYRLHYAMTQTMDLPSEIAGSYGIVQRRNLALLTIALAARDGTLAEATGLEATAVSLTGLRRPLALARHHTATGPTWLALVEIRDREAVTIEIRARATAAGPEITARFTRAFHLE
ncbi:MAG TPA: DUF4426 domain-containing protein [Steroidobacteraceae bacterium]|nr:DUF4426 domain-containing protein [Steroidobacteraceae bacterium]